jgi:hypothetical protein
VASRPLIPSRDARVAHSVPFDRISSRVKRLHVFDL